MKKIILLILLSIILSGCGGDLARSNPLDPKNPANQGQK